MNQPGKNPSFNGRGFVVAALLAPGIAITICFLGIALTTFSFHPDEIGRIIGSWLLLLLIVSVWGALLSLFFGGMVLAVIQRFWPGRPDNKVVLVAGGALAASLYVLTGLGVAKISPGLAMFFAPWATPDLDVAKSSGDWWILASLLLAGTGAGLIYSVVVKRG